MAWSLVALPALVALVAGVVPSNRLRPALVPLLGMAHAALVAALVTGRLPAEDPFGWLGLDPLNRVVLAEVSGVYLVSSFYAPGYLNLREERDNRVFCAAVSALLGTMSLALLARHLGLMWVGLETATLCVAPLLYFNRNRRSIEATWKYLLVGSVGIALALLGSFFLAYASIHAELESSLVFESLAEQAPKLSKPWLQTAIVFLFVGYGTKMGLAPMHTWKPDAYGEAPGFVGTLLAGAMTSCAFVAVLRAYQIAALAGEGPFARKLLVALGLFSMATAAVFVVRQDDFKRMLAYSSVEHMGILALGVGLGGTSAFGALYHLLTNGFTKGVLFLAAGNIHRAYRSKLATEVKGAFVRTPVSAGLLLAGFFAITGAPPFGVFMSELVILQGALATGRAPIAIVFLVLLLVIFVGMGTTVLQVVQGEVPESAKDTPFHDTAWTALPIFVFLGLSLLLGLWLPAPVWTALEQARAYVEGS